MLVLSRIVQAVKNRLDYHALSPFTQNIGSFTFSTWKTIRKALLLECESFKVKKPILA